MRKITELMDNPVPFTDDITHDQYTAYFTIEDVEYTFYSTEESNKWIIDFEASNIGGIGGSTGITGTGNEFIVFATIAAIMKKFIQQYSPETFSFSAKEKSRVKLYYAFSQKIADEWGYEVSVIDGLQSTVFIFT